VPSDIQYTAPLPIAPLDHPERLACLRLIRSENVGPVTFRQLVNHFGGATLALEALPDLARRGGGRRKIRICPEGDATAELEAAQRIGATPLFTIEPGYPAPLAAVDHPPPMIYAKGNTALLNRPGIAIVGSRNCSSAGHAFARQLASNLGDAHLVVISGLARGIDGAAHEAALENGTIAVVAGGIDVFYPPDHAKLQRRIAEIGCLVSEMPPGFKPRAKEFPRRNRLISGISYGVVVVEAARRSGTLITARLANEQGREVFAVPGHPLDPRAEGTNRLIKSGATMITEASDILDAIRPMLPDLASVVSHRDIVTKTAGVSLPAPSIDAPTNEERSTVERALGPAPIHVDDLLRSTGLSAQHVQIALLELSLAGRLEFHGAHLVSLRLAPN
jgi:DNA processing protein